MSSLNRQLQIPGIWFIDMNCQDFSTKVWDMTRGESANNDITDSSILLLLAHWRDNTAAVHPCVSQRLSLFRWPLFMLLTHHLCFPLPIRLSSMRMRSTLAPFPPTRLAISQKKSWKNTGTRWRESNRATKVSSTHSQRDFWHITGYWF